MAASPTAAEFWRQGCEPRPGGPHQDAIRAPASRRARARARRLSPSRTRASGFCRCRGLERTTTSSRWAASKVGVSSRRYQLALTAVRTLAADSRRATATISRFPVADRDAAAKVFAGTPTLEFVCSPGPGAYDVKRSVPARVAHGAHCLTGPSRALSSRARATVASASRARRRFRSRKDGLRRGSSRRSRRISARARGRASTITTRSSRSATAPLALRNAPSTTTSTSDRACPPPPTADAKRRTSGMALCWVLKSRGPPRRPSRSGRNRPQWHAVRLNRAR